MKFALGLILSLAIATPVTPGQSEGSRSIGLSSTVGLPLGGDHDVLPENPTQVCESDLEAGQIEALNRALAVVNDRVDRLRGDADAFFPIILSVRNDLQKLKESFNIGECYNKAMILGLALNVLSLWLVKD